MSIHRLASCALLVVVLASGCASNKRFDRVEALRSDPTWPKAATDSIHPRTAPDVTLNKDAGRGSYLFVTLTLQSGEELAFIVDTGSPVTVFAKSLESKLGKRVGTIAIWRPGIGGMRRSEGGVFEAPKLFLDGTPLPTGSNVFTSSMRRPTLFAGRRVQGILGMDCLRHYCLQLDFAAGKMRFLDPERVDATQLGQAFPITFARGGGSEGVPVIENAGLCGGTGTNLLIDTGCRLDGFVEDGAIRARGLGRLFSWFSRSKRVSGCTWEGTEYTKLRVRTMGRQNALGLRFLARHLVTLDFPRRTMYLKQTTVRPLSMQGNGAGSNEQK